MNGTNEHDTQINYDKEFLNWIYERMICIHGEKDLYDYMINFKSIIDRQDENASLREQLAKERTLRKELVEAVDLLYSYALSKGYAECEIESFLQKAKLLDDKEMK